jgi:glycosyltransferase involved in cell wall biosynthesis
VVSSGRLTLYLDAQLKDGTWHCFFSRNVNIRRQRWPFWLGGGTWTDLMFFQMPGQLKHLPRAVVCERFPKPRAQNENLRVTIVTPSFQQAAYLDKTMQSVLQQTNVGCEYIVQDGGSNDGSPELIRKIAARNNSPDTRLRKPDPHTRVGPSPRLVNWESAKDFGQADAIARGFAKTTGSPTDIMAWINSDDYYMPGALAYAVAYFAKHPHVDVIYGHRILVDESSREIGRWFLPAHDEEVLKLNDFVPQETMFWRRRIWEKVGGIDPSLKFAMDWDLLLRFQAAGAKIVRVPYFLACFRIHSAQKTSAQMESIGQKEIDALRLRTFGRVLPPSEIETHPCLLRYLRKSAWIEFLWRRLRIRHP